MNRPPEEFVSLDYRGRWAAYLSQLRRTRWITMWLRNLNFPSFQWEGALKKVAPPVKTYVFWRPLVGGWHDIQGGSSLTQSSQIASKAVTNLRERRESQGWIWLTKPQEGTASLRLISPSTWSFLVLHENRVAADQLEFPGYTGNGLVGS